MEESIFTAVKGMAVLTTHARSSEALLLSSCRTLSLKTSVLLNDYINVAIPE